jgi:hypothetical protein
MHTIAVGGLPLPAGGFIPQTITAELMKDGDNNAPDYWQVVPLAAAARLFKMPRIISAGIVTKLGDGNAMPFRGDKGNVIYIRFVVGSNLFALNENDITMEFQPPPTEGDIHKFVCTTPAEGVIIPSLGVVGDAVPSYQGRLGAGTTKSKDTEVSWSGCELKFRREMIYYANSVIYVGLQLSNPEVALKINDPLNRWQFRVNVFKAYGVVLPQPIRAYGEWDTCKEGDSQHTVGKTRSTCSEEWKTLYYLQAPKATPTTLMPGFGGSVSTLGKLSNIIITPSNFGIGQQNAMDIFFKTENEVGTVMDTQTEIWVDAPSGFDFGRYCAAYQLADNYYIPEPKEKTFRLPVGAIIECSGSTTNSNELTFNRAKIKTTGRILKATTYGFRLVVANTQNYVRSQLNEWRMWTYLHSLQAGVDGSYETARFNERVEVGIDTSFGCYQKAMPPGALGVSIVDLRPTVGGLKPTEITFLPIIVQLPMQKAIRILAPSGYAWDFDQTEFKYKAPGRGILESQAVPGAEQDLPITGVPAKPIAEPRNKLSIDYMQAEWIPGVKYGFIARIQIPVLPPTTASNFFSIEFGYLGLKQADRLEAGVVEAPMVRRIINGMVSFITSIVGIKAEIIFSMQLITKIPRAGGLVILGPPNFMFEKHCQPKPVGSFPELPYDSTCLFRQIPATGQLEISMVAGPSGILPYLYKFTLMGTNPPQAVSEDNAGHWTFNSYELLSEQIVLDYQTSVNGTSVNNPMIFADVVAPPKKDCWFTTLAKRAEFPDYPITNCVDFRDWQFYPPHGYRDDRPNKPSQMVFRLQLNTKSYNGKDIVIRAPEGYVFNSECKVVVKSNLVFNDTNTNGAVSELVGFNSLAEEWPGPTLASDCYGRDNVARITITCGDNVCLQDQNKYVFRIDILKNPPQTPVPNLFTIEYNGEASDPFPGVLIWAFTNGTIIPTTTASSMRHVPTVNNVTVYLRPTNDLPNGGHLRVEAPAGFVIQTNCRATIAIHKDETLNMTEYPAGPARDAVLRYSEFLPGDVICEGDVTMSSRSRLKFPRISPLSATTMSVKDKYLQNGTLYVFVFEVTNPQTTSQWMEPWVFTSYQDMTPNEIIDTASIPGFAINDAAPTFLYMAPNSVNALANQLLEFNMSFPMDVIIGDMIEIVAPVTFYFSEDGDDRCPDYQYLDGSMRKTVPVCGGNTMTWYLQEEMVPSGTAIRFLTRVKNPPSTPDSNLFQVRQISPTGKRKSSRMIPGYAIIPELDSVRIVQTPVDLSCRPAIPVASDCVTVGCDNCTATSSYVFLEISFMPMKSADLVQLRGHVDGAIFDFSNSFYSDEMIPVNTRTSNQITAEMAVRPGTEVGLSVYQIMAPSTTGMAKFTVTTYSGTSPMEENRIDEKLDLPCFEVLHYIDLITSRVNPIYYRAKDAQVQFELEPHMDILVNDVLRITRPPGYTIKEGSFAGFRDLTFTEHGLDTDRKWSTNYQDPEDYYVVISKKILARSRILWTLTVDLPESKEKVMNWKFRTYRVLPQIDTDGEILDASPVPYPWIGRDGKRRGMIATGTNDGAFSGFLLVGEVPFTVNPELQTPGAEITLAIDFKLPYTVQAKVGGEVRMEVTAPTGFVFRDSCFMIGSPQFRKCTGYRATATLVSTVRQVVATQITINLAVTNPGVTPTRNVWTLAVFKDDDVQYVNWSPGVGYEILPMTVVYRGNNQLAVSDTGFFDFTPLQSSLSEILHIVFIPPANQGYRLLCTGRESLGFSGNVLCESGSPNSNLKLTFSNGTLEAARRYTVGIGILNPGGKPLEENNYWGILLKDNVEKTFDGNLRIPGLELKTIPIRAGSPFLGWLTTKSRVMNTVTMQMRVLHRIPAAMITKFVIGAPYGVRFMEDPNAVKVGPVSLPLYEANPTEVANPSEVPNSAGPLLLLNLDVTQDIADGVYTIQFECSNPGEVVWDNTWSIIVMKDIEVEYSHYNVGFQPGEESPFEVTGGSGGGGTVAVSNQAARQHQCPACLAIFLAGLFHSAIRWQT